MGGKVEIREGDFETPALAVLLRHHYTTSREVTPGGNAHVFPIDRLRAEDIRFWSFWRDKAVVGFGGLKRLSPTQAEVKSMHVAASFRGQGMGEQILSHIDAAAQEMGIKTMFLETGTVDYFLPARRLYQRCGYVECGPFATYGVDPQSTYMMKDLRP
ncbi:MAG: GNAT family N-acetyltransferase [Pseudomonadota bacterium]